MISHHNPDHNDDLVLLYEVRISNHPCPLPAPLLWCQSFKVNLSSCKKLSHILPRRLFLYKFFLRKLHRSPVLATWAGTFTSSLMIVILKPIPQLCPHCHPHSPPPSHHHHHHHHHENLSPTKMRIPTSCPFSQTPFIFFSPRTITPCQSKNKSKSPVEIRG